MSTKRKAIRRSRNVRLPRDFDGKKYDVKNPNAAGIDIGSTFHVVAVSADRDPKYARAFGCYTADLEDLVSWLVQCGVTTVAMESTGVYWLALYQMLDARGIEVCLIRPQSKNLPGRKDDVNDAIWLQKLHTFGLLSASFRPSYDICVLRSIWRLRSDLAHFCADELRRMQKYLELMNVQLHKAISDISGDTGMSIIRSIISGDYDPASLAAYRDRRIKCSEEELIKALTGDYRREHIFALRQALARYDSLAAQIKECDAEASAQIASIADKLPDKPQKAPKPTKRSQKVKLSPVIDLHAQLYNLTGRDLTLIPGLGVLNLMTLVTETGTDMTKSEGHYCSHLGLSPHHKISGGKLLSSKTRPVVSRAATTFRMAALAVSRTSTALGAFYRRKKAQLGAPKAIVATAHKIALTYYRLMRYGDDYVEVGAKQYEEQYRQRKLKALQRSAAAFGFDLVKLQGQAATDWDETNTALALAA